MTENTDRGQRIPLSSRNKVSEIKNLEKVYGSKNLLKRKNWAPLLTKKE